MAWRWFRRTVLRRKGKTIAVSGSINLKWRVAEARAQVTKARPSDNEPLDEWWAYLESRLDNLGERIDWLTKDVREGNPDVRAALSSEATALRTEIGAVRDQLFTAVGGREGSGLVAAWWGLLAVLVGSVLQGFADIFG